MVASRLSTQTLHIVIQIVKAQCKHIPTCTCILPKEHTARQTDAIMTPYRLLNGSQSPTKLWLQQNSSINLHFSQYRLHESSVKNITQTRHTNVAGCRWTFTQRYKRTPFPPLRLQHSLTVCKTVLRRPTCQYRTRLARDRRFQARRIRRLPLTPWRLARDPVSPKDQSRSVWHLDSSSWRTRRSPADKKETRHNFQLLLMDPVTFHSLSHNDSSAFQSNRAF